jgi:hypothetical protein
VATESDRAPVLSVLIPCWNAADSIEAAVESVLATRSVPLEVVVVDDASTDGSATVVEAIAARDPRVILVRQPANAGVSAARNRGLQVVRGEWLGFLDSDDRWLPGGIDLLAARAREGDALAVVGQRVWTDGHRKWITPVYDIPDIREPGRKSLATHPGLVYYAAIHGKLFHRSTWEDTPFEGRVLGDQPWTISALLRAGDRIDVVADDVYEWWRPRADAPGLGITALSRSSARQGAVAAGVAIDAFAKVRAVAETTIDDEAARGRLVATYLERLMRSDFGGYLRRALRRRDPTITELLAAYAAFLETVPPAMLAASEAVRSELLIPPLHHWPRLSAEAQAAWAAMAAPVIRADPSLEGRLDGERAGPIGVYVRTGVDLGRRVLRAVERRVLRR